MKKLRTVRGIALATVLFLLVILIFLAASLFKLVPSELNWTLQQKLDNEGYYAATAGVKHCTAWLSAVTTRKIGGDFPAPYNPFSLGASSEPFQGTTIADPSAAPYRLRPNAPSANAAKNDETYFPPGVPALRSHGNRLSFPGGWAADVIVFPDKWTSPHPFAAANPTYDKSPGYTIVSLAYQDSNGNGSCDTAFGEKYAVRVECSVVGGTFSRYAYFIDQWDSAPLIAMNLPSGNTRPVFGGPFHTNGVPILRVAGAGVFGETVASGGIQPHFASDLTFAGTAGNPAAGASPSPDYDGVAWQGGNFLGNAPGLRPFQIGGGVTQAVPGRYERLFKKGKDALKPRQRIDLPVNSDRVALAAFGYKDGDPTPDFNMAPSNELFIRKNPNNPKLPLGGVIVNGGVQSALLDVIDTDGGSPYSNNHDSPTPVSGGSMLRLKHDVSIPYETTIQRPIYSMSSSTFVGVTTSLEPGFPADVMVDVTYQTGTTQHTVSRPLFGPDPMVVLQAPGGGPISGTPAPVQVITGYVNDTVTEPIYATSQAPYHYVSGMATHVFTSSVQVGTTNVVEVRFYSPTDYILEAPSNTSVQFHASYFSAANDEFSSAATASAVPVSQMPVILTNETMNASTAFITFPVPAGKCGVLRHSRHNKDLFLVEILDKAPNGAVVIEGPVNNLRGWNKGRKTISAERRVFSGNTSSATQYPLSIVGPIRQFGVTQGDLPVNGDNSVGLIGSAITLNVKPDRIDTDFKFTASKTMYVYAALMALKGQFATDFTTVGSKYGSLEVIGSVVQQRIGDLQGFLGGVIRGWASSYRFDRFLELGPPVAYPLDGTFQVYFFKVETL
jgi:hypothetical protein